MAYAVKRAPTALTRTERMADFLERTLLGKSTLDPTSLALPADRAWRHAQAVTVDQATEILVARWTSADGTEALAALALLERMGGVRRIGKSWKVIRPAPTPGAASGWKPPPIPRGGSPKRKPGVCPRCELKVENTNRHGNRLHTRDDCRFNVVKKIMEE